METKNIAFRVSRSGDRDYREFGLCALQNSNGAHPDYFRLGKPRVYRTGRNQQFNAKVTAETMNKIYKLADERKVPIGELLRLAAEALEREEVSKQ